MAHPPRDPSTLGDADTLGGIPASSYARTDISENYPNQLVIETLLNLSGELRFFRNIESGDAVAIDFSDGPWVYANQGSTGTWTVTTSNLVDGGQVVLYLLNSSGGSRTCSFPAGWNWLTETPGTIESGGGVAIMLRSSTTADSGVFAEAWGFVSDQASIGGFGDVTIVAPTANQLLGYNGVTGDWVNFAGTILFLGLSSPLTDHASFGSTPVEHELYVGDSSNVLQSRTTLEIFPLLQLRKTVGTHTATGSGNVDIEFDTGADQEAIDGGSGVNFSHSTSTNPEEVTCEKDGRIEISYVINGTQDTDNNRGIPRGVVERDTGGGFTELPGTVTHGFTFNESREEWCCTLPAYSISVSAGDKFKLAFDNASGTVDLVTTAANVWLRVKYVQFT